MNPFFKYLSITCMSLCFSMLHGDEVLVQYAFSGLQGDEHSLAPDQVTQGLTASELGRGKGLNYMVKVPNTFAANGWTTAGQPNASDYFEFEVKGSEGEQFTLTTLEFPEFANPKGPVFFTVRSSLDNFTSDLIGPLEHTDTILSGTHRVPLGANFQNLRGAVSFRLIAWGAKSGGSGVWALGAVKQPSWLKLSGSFSAKP